ncbi:acyltransferase [Carboxylicivirga sediminis]|uniref:Acyltransferase n=1 Tax=Carboxylicivirga sediminis TaxID=2006564 RepID=A0A941F5R5_9BACT|nr:acyltransferase [Carboxylicivirga sediminis]MBR8535745.1 acyltransferase [Carboxylicivirga sediminis]
MAFLTEDELKNVGFKSYGSNVLISDKASIYSPETISIGSHVRIDDFCLLSGDITLGNYIHISAYSALYGKLGIEMEDFTGLSPRCTIFSASDDFGGEYMISPMVPDEFTNVNGGKVTIKRFSQVGAGTVILPNVTLDEGTAIGAMSLVKTNTEEWSIFGGCPALFIKQRKKNILNLYESIK